MPSHPSPHPSTSERRQASPPHVPVDRGPLAPPPAAPPAALPRTLPFELPDDSKVVLLRSSAEWEGMRMTVATHLDIPAHTITLALDVPIANGQRREAMISGSAWPDCVLDAMRGESAPPLIKIRLQLMPEDGCSTLGSDSSGAVATGRHQPARSGLSPAPNLAEGTAKKRGASPSTSLSMDTDKKRRMERINVTARFPDGASVSFCVAPDISVNRLEKPLKAYGYDQSVCRLSWDGWYINVNKTFRETGIEDGDVVDVVRATIGGKPVIYLYPVDVTNVSVKLSVCPEWSFSAVYPSTPITTSAAGWEHLQWEVIAQPNSDLDCHQTGTKVTYLFWEATTNGTVSVDPGCSTNVFSPARPSLSPVDRTAVVLPAELVPGYVDRALEVLALSCVEQIRDRLFVTDTQNHAQRTDFITYWLHAINKHKHVALRFLPQAEYEPAAPLDITPAPDHVTRVFMLFRGVEDHHLDRWEAARARATQAVKYWSDIVGIDKVRQGDTTLFRVLEWGGMEVK